MCGIGGLISFYGKSIDKGILESMRDAISHRGPDDAGMYLSDDRMAGLVHRRLSIIDISSAGHQPMTNEDGTVWISFNGEIFNYKQLKKMLILQGHRFRSNCDTEVIIHLYEEYGDECLDRLNGQFAFVIWDSGRKRVFGARDRLGIRPFYYSWNDGIFAFASELKGMLPAVGKGDINYAAMTDYLVLQYIPAPNTIFKHIKKLEAGTCIIIENNVVKVRRYWQPQPQACCNLSEGQIVEKLDALLTESIKKQMIADVPLGVFLSGGVDSSAITALMAGITGAGVKAYSVGFEERDYNELNFATRVAESIPNVEHHKLILKADTAFSMIQELLQTLDEPFADQAIIPTYLMSRYAKESVTVCLSGEGSDEIFGGYDRYYNTIERVKLLGELTRFAPALRNDIHDSILLRYEDYIANLCSFHIKDIPSLLNRNAKISDDFVRTRFRNLYENTDSADDLQRVQRFDTSTYLADNLLFKVDRASMLASLEVRVPFLDHELVNFCLGLPFHLKYRSHIQKYILKKMMMGKIPNEAIYRRKMGFSVPIFVWFQNKFNDYLRDTLLSKRAKERGIFRPGYVEAMLEPSRMMTDRHNSLKLWCLLILEEWHRRHYD
ncbi:MAG: asparagine synthase (glutamine-hydrolyzing) [Deltaproteobacteria bacterium]|nr:asparagine synthase (glutamine-hydrolyzing) [Deltaproteobacteria bacterium]